MEFQTYYDAREKPDTRVSSLGKIHLSVNLKCGLHGCAPHLNRNITFKKRFLHVFSKKCLKTLGEAVLVHALMDLKRPWSDGTQRVKERGFLKEVTNETRKVRRQRTRSPTHEGQTRARMNV